MVFLSQLLVPRSVRRARHPVRYARRRATPRTVRRVSYTAWGIRHPVRRTTYRAVSRSRRRRKS